MVVSFLELGRERYDKQFLVWLRLVVVGGLEEVELYVVFKFERIVFYGCYEEDIV